MHSACICAPCCCAVGRHKSAAVGVENGLFMYQFWHAACALLPQLHGCIAACRLAASWLQTQSYLHVMYIYRVIHCIAWFLHSMFRYNRQLHGFYPVSLFYVGYVLCFILAAAAMPRLITVAAAFSSATISSVRRCFTSPLWSSILSALCWYLLPAVTSCSCFV